MSDGGAYKISSYWKEGKLVYKLANEETKGITFSADTYATFPKSMFKVHHPNGLIEYLDRYGNLVAQRDRFGNVIKYEDLENVLKITDTVGRVVTFTFEDIIKVRLPNGMAIQYIKRVLNRDFYNDTSMIIKKIDQNGLGTEYVYDTQEFYVDFYSNETKPRHIFDNEKLNMLISGGSSSGDKTLTLYENMDIQIQNGKVGLSARSYDYEYPKYNNISINFFRNNKSNRLTYYNLDCIIHPSGEKTYYEYEKKKAKVSAYGFMEYYAVKSRHDLTKDGIKNQVSYSYAYNGNDGSYSGYNLGQGVASLPRDYTYYFVETSGNIKMVYEFNYKHVLKRRYKFANNKKVEEVLYSYDNMNLPVEIYTAVYDLNSNSTRSKRETFEYNYAGNITAYWGPIDDGYRFDEYKVTYVYDSEYQILKEKRYKQDNDTFIYYDYSLTADKKSYEYSRLIVNSNEVQKTTYTLMPDGSGRIKSAETKADKDTMVKQDYTYDSYSNLSAVRIDNVGEMTYYDIMGNVTYQTDKNGYGYSYSNDVYGRPTRITNPDSTSIKMTYDDINNKVTTENEKGLKMEYTYNFNGQIKRIYNVSESKSINTYNYDSLNLLTSEVNAKNITTSYSYDEALRPKSINVGGIYRENINYNDAYKQSYSYIESIKLGSNGGPDIKTATYVDGKSNMKNETVFDGNDELTSNYVYDYVGNLIRYKSPKDNAEGKFTTEYYLYNGLGLMTKRIDGEFNNTNYEYDKLGRKISETDPKGNKHTFAYDVFSNLIEESRPISGTYRTTKKYTYDKNGNKLTETITSNKPEDVMKETKTNYTYDVRNRLTKVQTGTLFTQYTYDAVGNIKSLITGNGYGQTYYEYDINDKLISLRDNMGLTERYTYDDLGNLVSKVDRNGITTSCTYDNAGRLTNLSATKQNSSTSDYRVYVYSANGLLMNVANNITITNYAYDSVGRLKREVTNNAINEYSYDKNSNRTNFKLYYNNALKMNTSYEYNANNKLTRVLENNSLKAKYTYDRNGNMVTQEYGNGVRTSFVYNEGNLLSSLSNTKDMNVLSSYSYNYYLDGNQESKTDNLGNITKYEYDEPSRLTIETNIINGEETSKKYEYDNFSNRLKMVSNSQYGEDITTYTYDRNNRLIKESSLNEYTGEKGLSTYGYDNNGNLISSSKNEIRLKRNNVVSPDINVYTAIIEEDLGPRDYTRYRNELAGIQKNADANNREELNVSILEQEANPNIGSFETSTYTYNALNMLTTIETKGDKIEYSYKANGQRHSKKYNGILDKLHVWDGSNIVADVDSSNDISDRFIRGAGLISSDEHGYYLYNGHKDVVQLTDMTGAVRKDYRYDAFGVEEGRTEEDTNPFRYTGEYFDSNQKRFGHSKSGFSL